MKVGLDRLFSRVMEVRVTLQRRQTSAAQRGPVRIRFNDKCPVLLEDQNEDRFVMTSDEAVSACLNQSTVHRVAEELRGRLDNTLRMVAEWSQERPEVIRALVTGPNTDQMLFLIVVEGKTHRFELDDDVSELSLQVGNRLEWLPVPVRVMTVPVGVPDAAESFMDLSKAFEIYAKPGDTSSEG